MSEINIGGDSLRVEYPLFQVEGDGSSPISPLQLRIQKCSLRKAKELNRLWHSILPEYQTGFLSTAKICFTAIFNNIYYATAIWSNPSSPALSSIDYLELRRLAIAPDAPRNTASRMIRIMTNIIKREFPEIKRLISYQDTSVHQGIIYKASGWENVHTSKESVLKTGKYRTIATGKNSAPKIRWQKGLRI